MASTYDTDFYNRYGMFSGDQSDQEVQTKIRTRSMQRADAAESDAEVLRMRDRDLFKTALDELKSAPSQDSAAQAAYMYAGNVARIQNLTAGGHYEEASQLYRSMRESVDRNRDALMALASTRPGANNKLEQSLQIGAMALSQYLFDSEPVSFSAGSKKSTIGQFYQDGGTYKEQSRNILLGQSFSNRIVDTMTSPLSGMDPEAASLVKSKRSILGMIIDPVVAVSQRSEGTKHHEFRGQHSALADYVNDNYGQLVGAVGEDGLRYLVADVLDNRCADSTSMSTFKFVVNRASSMMSPDASASDKADAVRQVNDELTRCIRSMTTPESSPDRPGSVRPEAYRFGMMTVDMATDGGKKYINFDDPYVQSAMSDVVKFAALTERLKIPLVNVVEDNNGQFRKMTSEWVDSYSRTGQPPKDSMFSYAMESFESTVALFSGGCNPVDGARNRTVDLDYARGDSVKVLGSSSGFTTVDNARARMVASLWGNFILPSLVKGKRPDLAMRSLMTDGDERSRLAARLSDDLSYSLGLSSDTAAEVIPHVMSAMWDGNALRPVDLDDVMAKIIGPTLHKNPNTLVSRKAEAEIMKWFVAEGNATVFRQMDMELTRRLMDPVTGLGLKDKADVDAALQRVRMGAVDDINSGNDPRFRYRTAGYMGNMPVHTGMWLLPDGSRLTDDEFRTAAGKKMGQDGKRVELPKDHRLSGMTPQDRMKLLRSASPEIQVLKNVNINNLGGAVLHGIYDVDDRPIVTGLNPGCMADDPDAVTRYASVLRSYYDRQEALLIAAGKAAVSKASK